MDNKEKCGDCPKTYTSNIICGNCGFVNVIFVEDGKYVKDHLRIAGEACSNCKKRISSENYSIKPKGL